MYFFLNKNILVLVWSINIPLKTPLMFLIQAELNADGMYYVSMYVYMHTHTLDNYNLYLVEYFLAVKKTDVCQEFFQDFL